MKLICSKSNLLYGVNTVSKAVPTRTTMAILECILIDASSNEIKLTANDMELGIETVIDGTIEENGTAVILPLHLTGYMLNKRHASGQTPDKVPALSAIVYNRFHR